MSGKTWLYLCGTGIGNLRRHKVYTAAAVVTMSVCIFLFGIFYLVIANMDNAFMKTEREVYVAVFFEEDVRPERIDEVGAMIRKRPEVLRTSYVSPAEAWEMFQKEFFDDKAMLEGIFEDDNPLAASGNFQVYIDSAGHQQDFVNFVTGLEGVRKAAYSSETAAAILRVREVASRLVAGSMVLFFLISVLLIHTTLAVGIDGQKEKTRVLRLMGAREEFIRLPFLMEGLLMGAGGICIPLVLLYAGYYWGLNWASSVLAPMGEALALLAPASVFPGLVRFALFMGIGAGVAGGISVMGKFKKQ